jgi:hypothetical protein
MTEKEWANLTEPFYAELRTGLGELERINGSTRDEARSCFLAMMADAVVEEWPDDWHAQESVYWNCETMVRIAEGIDT